MMVVTVTEWDNNMVIQPNPGENDEMGMTMLELMNEHDAGEHDEN